MMGFRNKICWCCLKTEGNMKFLSQNSLSEDYLNLIGIKTCSWDNMPQWLCWLCAKEIKKARAFQISTENSYSLLISQQFQQHTTMVAANSIIEMGQKFTGFLPSLSQSVLELWSTPETHIDSYDDFLMEDSNIKSIDDSNDSDSAPLIKLESYDGSISKLNVAADVIFNNGDDLTQQNPIRKLKVKIKKKKNKKDKKKNKAKGKRKLSAVVLKNRMVLETKQYKVIRLTPEQAAEEREKTLNSTRYLASPYKCQFCAKGFNYEDVLINHMSKHEQKQDHLECKLCHQFLPSVISLRGHTKSHLVRYECRECGEVRASRQHLLEHHSLQHRIGNSPPKQYTCNICGKMMMKRTMFQKHVRLHSPSTRLPCEKCGKSFKTIETLRAHKLRHAEIKRYKCPDCPKEFRYASLLYTHRVTHITTRNFYCVECDLSFKTQSNLRLHLNKSQKHVDPESLKFQCNECDKRYATELQLQHHVECIHMGKREYACPSCDRQYATKDGLRAHTRKEHPPPGAPPPLVVAKHICDICSRAFKAKAVLVKHIRTHTGERPFQCAECSRAFSQRSTLATHVKLVHRNKKNKMFNPPDKLFLNNTHLEHNIHNT